MGWVGMLLVAGALATATPAATASGPLVPDRGSEMVPIDICLRAIERDPERPCVRFVDGGGRAWLIAEVARVHLSLRGLRFKPGQTIRVIGQACGDCLHPICGEFTGFIFDARIVPYVPGDVTGDGIVNIRDLVTVLESVGECGEAPSLCPCDLDRSGFVDFDDVEALIEILDGDLRG